MQYLIILLDDAAVSYCHYSAKRPEQEMPLDVLKKGILYAMKENLTIQYVFPPNRISDDLSNALDEMYNSKVMSSDHVDRKVANVIIFDDADKFIADPLSDDAAFVLRVNKANLFKTYKEIALKFRTGKRISIVITDINKFTEDDFKTYSFVLETFKNKTLTAYQEGKNVQLNLLCDRLALDKMNNCEAGVSNITLAPNGKFYICPAFYYEDKTDNVGDLENGVNIQNAQLYQLDHAPLCRRCDAYQCHRCVWLNRKTTLEVNTPSHEQCVVAHLERNASRKLLIEARNIGEFLPHKEIKEIDYLDPFDVRTE